VPHMQIEVIISGKATANRSGRAGESPAPLRSCDWRRPQLSLVWPLVQWMRFGDTVRVLLIPALFISPLILPTGNEKGWRGWVNEFRRFRGRARMAKLVDACTSQVHA